MECSICTNEFNELDRIPKFLSCHHTFCVQCIQLMGRIDGNIVNISCPHCRHEYRANCTIAQLPNLLTTNRYIIEHQKTKQMAAEKLINSERGLSTLKLAYEKMRSENRQLKVAMALCSKWCSACGKMAKSSCGLLGHLLVEVDEERKVFPCTNSLEDLMAQTKAKWGGILDERKAIGESLKKIEDHLTNFVTQQLHEYMKSNEERAKCIAGLKAEIVSFVSTQTICLYEQKYRSYLEESVKELDALKNITQQAKSIDNWKAQADHYQRELQQAREKNQEFGERSPWLFKLLLELVGPGISFNQIESDSSAQPSQMRDLVQDMEDRSKRKRNC